MKLPTVAVLQQLIIFLKYVNPDTGVAKTEFLATKCIDDPRGTNAEVVTDHILDTLKEYDLEVRVICQWWGQCHDWGTQWCGSKIETCQQSPP